MCYGLYLRCCRQPYWDVLPLPEIEEADRLVQTHAQARAMRPPEEILGGPTSD